MNRGETASKGWRRSGQVLIGVLLTMIVAGCVKFPSNNGPAPSLYTLAPETPRVGNRPLVRWQLMVGEPTAPAALDTDRIALRPHPLEIEYYAHARWSDRIPKMVQRLLVSGFEKSGRIVAVGASGGALRADYELDSELWDFTADYVRAGKAPTVQVRLVAKMVRESDAGIIAARSFSASVPAASDTLNAVVTAFDKATGQVIRAVVPWALGVPDAKSEPDAGDHH